MNRLILAAIAAASVPATAGVIGTTGDFTVFPSSSASYIADAFNDPTPAPMRIWIEQTAIELASAVVLDTDLADSTKKYVVGGAGKGEVAFKAGGGPTLAKGTRVNVYYAYFDPKKDTAFGTVTFAEKILGIVAHTNRLQFSDFLRVPGSPYPKNPAFGARGWENSEWGQVDAARTTFTWYAKASSPGDQFRIFTEASGSEVPEPTSFVLIGLGLVAFGMARRVANRQPGS
jgi:hypothetical protein